MRLVDRKTLLDRLDPACTRALEAAIVSSMSRGHDVVTVEHVVVQMLAASETDCARILGHFRVDAAALTTALERELGALPSRAAERPVYSPRLFEWLESAWLFCSAEMGVMSIRTAGLLCALVYAPERYCGGRALEALARISGEALKRDLMGIVSGSVEDSAGLSGAKDAGAPGVAAGNDGALGQFTVDVTARARAGDIDPVFGRDREVRQVVDILARRRKNNPILVGEPGVGKTALVEGLALRIAAGDVPEFLKSVDLCCLDMGLLQAGASVKGEFERRLRAVVDEVRSSEKPVILFIDEAHTLVGAGGAAGGSDAANLLKPMLARGELRTIAATTWSEYKRYFEKDAALSRRFQLVKVDEPDEASTVQMLRGLRGFYERAHGVLIRDDAIEAAVRLSKRYVAGRQLPDKAVDLLDTAAARVRVARAVRPEALVHLDRQVAELHGEIAALARDAALAAGGDAVRVERLRERLVAALGERDALEEHWVAARERAARVLSLRAQLEGTGAVPVGAETGLTDGTAASDATLRTELAAAAAEASCTVPGGGARLSAFEVDPDVVAQVVGDWTGIPVGRMVHDEARALLDLADRLGVRIRGQREAIDAVVDTLRAARAGLGHPRAPRGVFLFVGPSGVGKTETARALADVLFGGERALVTLNMSEFQERHTVSRLVGSAPGYVGYGEGGVLTEAVRQRPYCVVLLDEAEKAHREVLDIFHQVLDQGVLSDGEGRVIDFSNTTVVLTSNLAADVVVDLCRRETNGTPGVEQIETAIRPTLLRYFEAGLLARMKVVPFRPVDDGAMREIAHLKLRQVAQRLQEAHGMSLDVDEAVIETLVARCTEIETGARNVDHVIRRAVLPGLSSYVLGAIDKGSRAESLRLTVGDDGHYELRAA